MHFHPLSVLSRMQMDHVCLSVARVAVCAPGEQIVALGHVQEVWIFEAGGFPESQDVLPGVIALFLQVVCKLKEAYPQFLHRGRGCKEGQGFSPLLMHELLVNMLQDEIVHHVMVQHPQPMQGCCTLFIPWLLCRTWLLCRQMRSPRWSATNLKFTFRRTSSQGISRSPRPSRRLWSHAKPCLSMASKAATPSSWSEYSPRAGQLQYDRGARITVIGDRVRERSKETGG